MFHPDVDFGEKDPDRLFVLGIHHLRLAASIFEMFSPEEFAAALARASVPETVSGMMSALHAEKDLEGWLYDEQRNTAEELAKLDKGDEAGATAIWDRHEATLRARLWAAGYSEEQIQFEMGETAAMAQERRGE